MGDFAQVLRNKPDWLCSRHPIQTIKASQVHWAREGTQGSLSAQIVVSIEIAHCQFTQGAIDGIAKANEREILLRDGAPALVHTIDCDDMIAILNSLKIQEQGFVSIYPQ